MDRCLIHSAPSAADRCFNPEDPLPVPPEITRTGNRAPTEPVAAEKNLPAITWTSNTTAEPKSFKTSDHVLVVPFHIPVAP